MKKSHGYRRLILLAIIGLLIFAISPVEGQAKAKPKISKKKVVLQAGKTKQLKVSGSGKNKVTWLSSRKSVAEVTNKGKVTAKKAGNAVIKAKVGSKVLKCNVTVVSLSLYKCTLKDTGTTKTLKVSNGKNTKWKSSNSKVVKVNKGKLTAVKAGKAKITCTSRGIKMTCQVCVPSVSHKNVTIENGKTFTYKVTNTHNPVRYSSSDSSVLSVNASTGVCKALTYGSATVTAAADGYTYKCSVTVPLVYTTEARTMVGRTFIYQNPTGSAAVQYSTSDNSILDVVVKNGICTCIAKDHGSCYITAKAGAKIYRCRVMVGKSGDIVTPSGWIASNTKGEQYSQKINVGNGRTRTYTVFHQTSTNGFSVKNGFPTGTISRSFKVTETVVIGDETQDQLVEKAFDFNVKNYISNHGCAACAATTILSGYLSEKQTPCNTVQNLEYEAFNSLYGNLYNQNPQNPWAKNYSKSEDKQMPLCPYGVQQLLLYKNIDANYVRSYSRPAVLKQIRDHLLTGRPVIITVRDERYDRVGVEDTRWTSGRHTMALLGMTDKYQAIVADSADRTSFGSMGRIKLVDLEDVCAYMFRCTATSGDNLTYPYYSSASYCGGYVLVNSR